MSALRVLLVTPSFHPAVRYGGPTYATWNLACALGARGVEVRVLTTNAHGRETLDVPVDREHERAPGVRVTFLARHAALGESVATSLPSRLAEGVRWADVVHLTAVYNATTFPTLIAVRRAARPLVWTPFGAHYYAERLPDVSRPWLKRAWDAAALRLLVRDRTTIVAESELEAETSEVRMPGVPVAVVREPVLVPERLASMQRMEGPLRLLFLARLHPIKGLERLIDALAGHTARLTIAGAGEASYVATLEAHARRTLGGRVRFVGHVGEADKAALFAEHELLVLPSHRESYGIVVGEALAHGVPALVVRPTAWERLSEARAGIVVAPDALAPALRSLDRPSLEAMREGARALAERELSVASTAERMIGLYEAMRARRRASPHAR